MGHDVVDISIVIPVYNAMPELSRTLVSLVSQSFGADRMEVVVIDDCSNDGSWDEICRFTEMYPHLFVTERLSAQSGSPARPRNIAMDKARGEYIFFLDADDWLGELAVAKMLSHAKKWHSDVLLVKLASENGRDVPQSMFTHDQPKVDVYRSKVMWSLGPLKLFRRSLLMDNNLRFFEAGMPEDLHVVIPALCLAKTVSVAADYEYCHVTFRDDVYAKGKNASLSIWSDCASNLRSYTTLMAYLNESTTEEERSETLMRRLFRRDVLAMIQNLGTDEESRSHYEMIKQLFLPYYGKEVYRTCPVEQRIVLDTFFFGAYEDSASLLAIKESLMGYVHYEVKKRRLLCSLPQQMGGICCDVTEGVQIGCSVHSLSCFQDGKIRIEGSVSSESLPSAWMKDAKIHLVCKDKHGLWRAFLRCAIGACQVESSGWTTLTWVCDGRLSPILGFVSTVGLKSLRVCLRFESHGFVQNIYFDRRSFDGCLREGKQYVGDDKMLMIAFGRKKLELAFTKEGRTRFNVVR